MPERVVFDTNILTCVVGVPRPHPRWAGRPLHPHPRRAGLHLGHLPHRAAEGWGTVGGVSDEAVGVEQIWQVRQRVMVV